MERGWHEAYHAQDMAPLDPASLGHVAADDFERIIFTPHPSLRLLSSPFPALSIWQMNIDEGVPQPIEFDQPENAVFLRPSAEVQVRLVKDASFAFLKNLARGETVVAALRAAARKDEMFDLGTNLAELFGLGAFVQWRLGEKYD